MWNQILYILKNKIWFLQKKYSIYLPKYFSVQLIAYILIFPFIYLISLLPFRLLYMLSDVSYVLVYHVFGYRRSTVTKNLKLVFPNKSEKHINSIRKKFYKHMCDMFLEMIKSITISEEQLVKRFRFKNVEELQRLEAMNKSVIVMYGHYASYEWSVVVVNHISFKGYGIYKPVENRYFDALVRRIRSKYNTTLIRSKEAISSIMNSEKDGIKSMTAFLSDQTPKANASSYWGEFMGIRIPCFTGAETLAKKLDLSVSYLKINKVKRGYYEAEFIPLADDANTLENYKITDKFTRELEKQIYEAPEFYLWTHKRWKHRNKIPENLR